MESYAQIKFPDGRHVVVLDIEAKDVLAPGSVPSHVRELDMGRAVVLEEGVVPPRLAVLAIDDMTDQMHIPQTVGYLFVWNYTGRVPLPQVRNIFIHAFDVLLSPINRDHYIHLSHSVFDLNACQDDDYEIVGKEMVIKVLGREISVLKRVLKTKTVAALEPIVEPFIQPGFSAAFAHLLESQQQFVCKLQSWITDQAQTYSEMATYLAEYSRTLNSQLSSQPRPD
ncbi:Hypothetical protein MVR_LOCUS55 [uncultured virus]|nr:Hypothetical protein MVR_LOCUS55 [uncultured virus]